MYTLITIAFELYDSTQTASIDELGISYFYTWDVLYFEFILGKFPFEWGMYRQAQSILILMNP